jgi:DNA-3-methyladenine glycosylase
MAANRGLDAGAPVRMLASGPSRLCQAMSLTRISHNGLDIASAASPLEVRDDGFTPGEVMVTARIGIKHAVDWPLRFALAGHSCVSGPRGRTATAFVPSKIPSY